MSNFPNDTSTDYTASRKKSEHQTLTTNSDTHSIDWRNKKNTYCHMPAYSTPRATAYLPHSGA